MSRRRNKKISEEDYREIQEFVYRKNQEEDKFLTSMSVHYKCKNENQGKLRESIRNNEISIVSGLPGTGKTFIACAEALKLIKSKSKYKKILLVKSITQLRGEELGSLPGDLNEKFDPYLGSFIDNFEKIKRDLEKSAYPELVPKLKRGKFFMPGSSVVAQDGKFVLIDKEETEKSSLIKKLCQGGMVNEKFCK